MFHLGKQLDELFTWELASLQSQCGSMKDTSRFIWCEPKTHKDVIGQSVASSWSVNILTLKLIDFFLYIFFAIDGSECRHRIDAKLYEVTF